MSCGAMKRSVLAHVRDRVERDQARVAGADADDEDAGFGPHADDLDLLERLDVPVRREIVGGHEDELAVRVDRLAVQAVGDDNPFPVRPQEQLPVREEAPVPVRRARQDHDVRLLPDPALRQDVPQRNAAEPLHPVVAAAVAHLHRQHLDSPVGPEVVDGLRLPLAMAHQERRRVELGHGLRGGLALQIDHLDADDVLETPVGVQVVRDDELRQPDAPGELVERRLGDIGRMALPALLAALGHDRRRGDRDHNLAVIAVEQLAPGEHRGPPVAVPHDDGQVDRLREDGLLLLHGGQLQQGAQRDPPVDEGAVELRVPGHLVQPDRHRLHLRQVLEAEIEWLPHPSPDGHGGDGLSPHPHRQGQGGD